MNNFRIMFEIVLFVVKVLAIEEFECSLNVQTLCAPGFKIREKYHDEFAHWNFDYDKFVDIGQHNHITNRYQVDRTNSIFGTGAYFQKDAQLDISFIPYFEGSDWSFSFIIMFEEIGRQTRSLGSFLTLYDEIEEPEQYLHIQLDSVSKHILIKEQDTGILKSNMRMQPALWYRVYVVLHDKKLKLYVNGIFEGEGNYEKQYPFKRLLIKLENNIPSFNIDSLKFYQRNLADWEIIAASQLFQQNIEWVKLNCENCDFEKARKCPSQYHLCTSLELYSFAITTAKNMGWGYAPNTNIWSQETKIKKTQITEALGLCCRDVDYILIS